MMIIPLSTFGPEVAASSSILHSASRFQQLVSRECTNSDDCDNKETAVIIACVIAAVLFVVAGLAHWIRSLLWKRREAASGPGPPPAKAKGDNELEDHAAVDSGASQGGAGQGGDGPGHDQAKTVSGANPTATARIGAVKGDEDDDDDDEEDGAGDKAIEAGISGLKMSDERGRRAAPVPAGVSQSGQMSQRQFEKSPAM